MGHGDPGGQGEEAVYLLIQDDKAELQTADHLWGKSVWETDALLKSEPHEPQMRVSAIGRAGETGVMYACIVNDLHRAAGRSGVGAVMGSKNSKRWRYAAPRASRCTTSRSSCRR